jgi:hypothetical protein
MKHCFIFFSNNMFQLVFVSRVLNVHTNINNFTTFKIVQTYAFYRNHVCSLKYYQLFSGVKTTEYVQIFNNIILHNVSIVTATSRPTAANFILVYCQRKPLSFYTTVFYSFVITLARKTLLFLGI